MKPAESILVVVIAIAALAAGAFFLLYTGHEEGGTTPDTSSRPDQPRDDRPVERATPEPVPERKPAPQPQQRKEAEVGASATLPQGFAGTVTDPSGTPVTGAVVFLVHGFQPQDLFALLGQARGGRMVRKLESETKTDQTGAFRLPSNIYSEMQPFEIVVEHPSLIATDKKGDLRVKENIYKDVGRIVLKPGNRIQGVVTMAGSAGAPIPDAIVRLRQGANAFFMRMPGGENGMETKTDAGGHYEFRNVETGSVELEAAAKGYAMEVRPGILIQDAQTANDQNFELQRGYEIAGVVTDATGKPIPQARVVADAISTKAHAPVMAFTGRDGTFELMGLLDGQYSIGAEADGFVREDKKPVPAGERNVQIALEKQGGVRVVVTGRNGQPLSRFTLELKIYFEGQPDNFGRVTDKYPVPVSAAKNGEYLLEGINPGSYVLQVEAPNHAKKYSEHFNIVAGAEPPLVQVQLGQGGTISGRILGANGAPLAGVSVSTMPNNLDENPFTNWIIGLVPKKITESQVVTGRDGSFKMALLLPDKYQIKINHPEYYRVNKKDVEVVEGQETNLGELKLASGVRVSGVVYVNGRPEPGVEVTISGSGGGPLFSEKAISDEKGAFRIGVPLPPGKYEATANRTQLSNPILKIVDYQKSKKEVVLLDGAATYELMMEINDTAGAPAGGVPGMGNPPGR